MPDTLTAAATLANDVTMPWFGLGVFRSQEGDEVENAVRWALDAGYRSIDTAKVYANETGVGRAIAESDVPRESIFVTTKVWNSDQGYDTTLRAFDASLERLGMSYIDLYLIHWPVKGKYKDTWRAIERIYKDGRARAIGVSNFLVHQLEDLLDSAEIVPMVDQVEFHPYLQQPPLQQFAREHGILLEAWSPIMKGEAATEPVLTSIGRRYGKNGAHVALRWILQKGIVAIPKSVRQERIVANAQVFDFELTPEEMARIDSLDRHHRYGPDPDNFNF
ncbi:MAG: aldo/keto reductase [Rhodothermales bacterium]